jgi:hypothetical protein
VELGVDSDEFGFTAGLEVFGKDVVAILVVDGHDVFVASAGGDRETASLVAEDLARYLDCLVVDPIGLDAVDRGWRHCHDGFTGRRGWVQSDAFGVRLGGFGRIRGSSGCFGRIPF